jgi:hypothetical protein
MCQLPNTILATCNGVTAPEDNSSVITDEFVASDEDVGLDVVDTGAIDGTGACVYCSSQLLPSKPSGQSQRNKMLPILFE